MQIAIDEQIIGHPVITSDSHPLHVDFLPNEVIGWGGRLGMTIAPGKCNVGMKAIWRRNLEQDLSRLQDYYKVNVLLTLLETPEFESLKIPNFIAQVRAHGIESWRFPIHDFGTPTSMSKLIELVDAILTTVQTGKTIVIHCKAGLGRTGLVTAACLIARGYSPRDAFAQVRLARPGSIETPAQEAYAAQFAQAWQTKGIALRTDRAKSQLVTVSGNRTL